MKNQIIKYFLPYIVDSLLSIFTREQILLWLDSQIDRLEKHIIDSPSSTDDYFLPAVKYIRDVFGIEDNDQEAIV